MSAVFRGHGTADSAVLAASQTLTLNASTSAGDTATILLVTGTSTTVTLSGLGATWTKKQENAGFIDGKVQLWVGAGCTAGQTVITVSFSPNDGCAAVALAAGGVPTAAGSALTLVTGASPAAPNESATSSAGDQMVVDLYLIDSAPTISSVSDSPAAFTTVDDVSLTNYTFVRAASAYRIPAETGTEARTLSLSASHAVACASVLLGQSIPAAFVPHRPLVLSRAVSRAAVI